MIGIATVTADTAGDIVLQELPESQVRDIPIRVSRSATLDGGVVIDHQGASHGDRTFEISAEVSADEADVVEAIALNHTSVHVATPQGFFLAAIQRCRVDNGELRLTILIKEKKDA